MSDNESSSDESIEPQSPILIVNIYKIPINIIKE